MLGYKLTGNWAERGVAVIAYTDRYTFNVLEQLLFRLATLDVKPTVYLIDKARKSAAFAKKELKGGGFLPTGDMQERGEYFYNLMGRFPQVNFIQAREVDFQFEAFIVNSLKTRSIISLGLDLSTNYEGVINGRISMDESTHNLYLRNSGNTLKYIQLLYGVNTGGNSEVELRFTQKNGVLTPSINEQGFEYGEPTRIDQTHDLRMITNLVVNDLLTGRYINYTGMSIVDDEIVKQRLVVPALTILEQSYLYNIKDEQKMVLNMFLGQVGAAPEGYSGLKDTQLTQMDHMLDEVLDSTVELFQRDGNNYFAEIFSMLKTRIPLIDDKELKGKWLQGSLMFQQKLIFKALYEPLTQEEE